MKKLLLLFSAALIVSFTACKKDDVVKTEDSTKKVELQMNYSAEQLANFVEVINEPITFSGKSADALSYTYVANLLPIVSGTDTLSAVTVDGYDEIAYVGWHLRGEFVEGGFTVISVANPFLPVVLEHYNFPNVEFNDLEVKDNVSRLFLCGEADTLYTTGMTAGDDAAVAWSLVLNVDGTINSFNWERTFHAFSSNSITYVANQTVWVSNGNNGGMEVVRDYDEYEVTESMSTHDAKHFDATGDWGVLLYGSGLNESTIRVYDMHTLYSWVEYTIPFDVTWHGKNAVDISGDFVYLAMGDDGVVKVDLTTGAVANVFNYGGIGFANGINVDWQYVYAAYGANGLIVLDKHSFAVIGQWDYDGSCNYVKKVGDFVYLANGSKDGMIILHKD